MKSKTLLLALLLSGASTLHAQNDGAQVSMRIDFVSWGEDLSGLEVRTGKRGQPVQALAFRYSEPIQYSGPQILTLTLALGQDDGKEAREKAEAYEKWLQSEDAEGLDLPAAVFLPKVAEKTIEGEIPKALAQAREKDPSLAALVKLPASSRRVTILLAPGPDRSLRSHIFDDDPTRQPPGTVRVHNLSPYPVSLLTASGKPIELLPGKGFLGHTLRGTFAYELAYRADRDWKIQENNLISIDADERVHMMILQNDSSFFTSSDGSRGGFMQVAFLRRGPP